MRRDELILQAAERLFHERGFAGVGVDAIGEEAGVTGSAIYRHFSSKDEILAELFDRAIDALVLDSGTPLPDPEEELERLITLQVNFALTHPHLLVVWEREYRSINPRHRKRYERRQRQYLQKWFDCLAKIYPSLTTSDLHAAVRVLLAMLQTGTHFTNRSHEEVEQLLRSMALASLSVFEELEQTHRSTPRQLQGRLP